MRKILASLIFFATPTLAQSEANPQLEMMCNLLQQSTTLSLIAIQDMGLELSELLIEDLEGGNGEISLHSKSVLDQGFQNFHQVLKIATEAQENCSEYYEQVFVETIRALS